MLDLFPRLLVVVAGDFRAGVAEVEALRALGARVAAAGLGGPAVRRRLEALGAGVEYLGRSRRRVREALLACLAGASAVFFTAGEWREELEAALDAERELAFTDGRFLRPFLVQNDPRYSFLNGPAQWAAFVLARAAGAGLQRARAFVAEHCGGHQN